MHTSQHAAAARTTSQPSKRTDLFSFPPTQRMGLPVSPAHRSSDQAENLQHSFERLSEALAPRSR